jgi:hypothetical protein
MWSEAVATRSTLHFLLRVGVVAAGTGAVLYATLFLALPPQAAALEHAAARIIMGDRYKAEELDLFSDRAAGIAVAPFARAASLRAAAIVMLRLTETAIEDGRRADIDARTDALAHIVNVSLSAAPFDAYLWLASFWRSNLVDGFREDRLRILAMSYTTGGKEGWVGIRRSRISLALWQHLTPTLQEAAAQEFVGLAKAGFREVVAIMLGPGWGVRDKLVPMLAEINEARRKAIARELYFAGASLEIPGIEPPDDRFWRRP